MKKILTSGLLLSSMIILPFSGSLFAKHADHKNGGEQDTELTKEQIVKKIEMIERDIAKIKKSLGI